MIYPDWAPKILVEIHSDRISSGAALYQEGSNPFNPFDPEAYISEVVKKNLGVVSEAGIEGLRKLLYRNSFVTIPDNERTRILGQLITDERMRSVWNSLGRRHNSDRDFTDFVVACEEGIGNWRGEEKLTASERKRIAKSICDATEKLESLMRELSCFDFYSINSLIGDKEAQWLLGVLDAEEKNDARYARFCLSEVLPSLGSVLQDVSRRAIEYAEREHVIRKPNSENAEVHYFCRHLSAYFADRYQQPLHEAVANTATVMFDNSNIDIDADYVRKIVQR